MANHKCITSASSNGIRWTDHENFNRDIADSRYSRESKSFGQCDSIADNPLLNPCHRGCIMKPYLFRNRHESILMFWMRRVWVCIEPWVIGGAMGVILALMLFWSIPSHADQWTFKQERDPTFYILVNCQYSSSHGSYWTLELGVCPMERFNAN